MPDQMFVRAARRETSGDLVVQGTVVAAPTTPAGDRAGPEDGGHDLARLDVRPDVHPDAHEHEADAVADRVLAGTHDGMDPQSGPAPNGYLDPGTRAFFERRFGHDFRHVRVHTDDEAAASADRRGAQAFTVGNDVSFARGRYAPQTRSGRALLAHELAHVVQQSDRTGLAGPAAAMSHVSGPTPQCKLVATGDAAGFASLASGIIAVQFEVVIGSGGQVAIRGTQNQGPPTREAHELTTRLRTIIDDPKTTTVEFIHGRTSTRPADRGVLIGSYGTGQLDLDDISALGTGAGGTTTATALVHELVEQYRKQVHGEAYATAHRTGEVAEEVMSGATRGAHSVIAVRPGTVEVTVPWTYPGGRVVDVIMTVTDGNVTGVVRRERTVP